MFVIVCSHLELGRICAGLLLFVYICIVIGDPIIMDVNNQFKPPHICGYPRARTWIRTPCRSRDFCCV